MLYDGLHNLSGPRFSLYGPHSKHGPTDKHRKPVSSTMGKAKREIFTWALLSTYFLLSTVPHLHWPLSVFPHFYSYPSPLSAPHPPPPAGPNSPPFPTTLSKSNVSIHADRPPAPSRPALTNPTYPADAYSASVTCLVLS